MKFYSFYEFNGNKIRTISGTGKTRKDFIAKAQKAGYNQAYRAKLVSDEVFSLIPDEKLIRLIKYQDFFLFSEWREVDPLDMILAGMT